MALTFYRGNVNLPLGGDPMNAVNEALKERRLRQEQLQDQKLKESAAMDRQKLIENMTRDRMLEVHGVDNDAALQRALLDRKNAQATRGDAQRKGVTEIQKYLGKGDIEGARAAALAAGIDDFGEATGATPAAYDDSLAPMGADAPPPAADPKAPKKYGFSVGGQRQEFEAAKPVPKTDNEAAAATFEPYLKDENPEVRKLAGVVRGQVAMGQMKPSAGVALVASRAAQMRGQNMSSENAKRNAGLAGRRIALDGQRVAAAVDKGDPTNDRAIRNAVAGYEGINAELDRYEALLQQGRSIPYTDLGERKETAQGAVALRLKDAEQMGALDAGVSNAVGKLIGSSTQAHLTPETARAKVDEARRYLKAQHEAKLNALRASKGEIRGGSADGGVQAQQKSSAHPAPRGAQSEDDLIDLVMRQAGLGK